MRTGDGVRAQRLRRTYGMAAAAVMAPPEVVGGPLDGPSSHVQRSMGTRPGANPSVMDHKQATLKYAESQNTSAALPE